MLDLITRKIDKNDGAIASTKFAPLQVYGKHFAAQRQGPIWPKIKLVQDFMPFLVTSKTEEDPIKNQVFDTQG